MILVWRFLPSFTRFNAQHSFSLLLQFISQFKTTSYIIFVLIWFHLLRFEMSFDPHTHTHIMCLKYFDYLHACVSQWCSCFFYFVFSHRNFVLCERKPIYKHMQFDIVLISWCAVFLFKFTPGLLAAYRLAFHSCTFFRSCCAVLRTNIQRTCIKYIAWNHNAISFSPSLSFIQSFIHTRCSIHHTVH